MTPRELRHVLDSLGYSNDELAEKLNCTKVELSQTINGHRVNRAVREKLARLLNRPVDKVFGPDFEAVRYQEVNVL